MTTPVRLRLRRVKDFDLHAHSLATNGLPAFVVTRGPAGRGYGNPFIVERHGTAQECVDLFEVSIKALLANKILRPLTMERLKDIRGKNLACFCALDAPCHADVWLRLANAPLCEAA